MAVMIVVIVMVVVMMVVVMVVMIVVTMHSLTPLHVSMHSLSYATHIHSPIPIYSLSSHASTLIPCTHTLSHPMHSLSHPFHQCSQLYRGEEYAMQIDSHMRFVPG